MLLADANPYISAQSFLNPGDNAWQMTAATFVGLQSIPGLAILYAGIVKKKWALNSAVMVFYAFSITLIAWVLFGYNMSFGNPLKLGPGMLSAFVGIPMPAITPDQMLGQATIPLAAAGMPPLRFSGAAMLYFQFVFAGITPILIAGSVLGRMNFKAWMIFVPAWSLIVYTVGAFSIWGGGWLAQLGALDYSGGYVIHLAAGISGFVAAAVVGPRMLEDQKDFSPNNLIMAFAGAGILWLGWNGFNGGDPYFSNADAAAAVVNTNLATACALLVWLIFDMFAIGKPSGVSMINGMIAGLVAITPSAGYVDGFGAIGVGVVGGALSWLGMNRLAHVGFFKKVDDTLGVLYTHAIPGLAGGLMVGIFSNPDMIEYYSTDKKTSPVSAAGLLYGTHSPALLGSQLWAGLFIIVFDAILTFAILKLIGMVVPLRASDGEVEGGDLAIHGMDPIPMYGSPPPVVVAPAGS